VISREKLHARTKVFSSEQSELRFLIEQFRVLSERFGASYNLYLHEFHSHWLSRVGYTAVRAFVPSFIKLHLNEHLAAPLGPRMEHFCKMKGVTYSEHSINAFPHFFP
jgi:hypothetical protein